ncbi:MAG: DUF116 domain-containing protein [Terrisporobacter sp.]|uniref:DUF116 domain-containing protein n=1 Tax=Terrisporobacter sp. TaxID=1965305 RepID=UPI0025EF1A6C|nr:DUF116 domain-containing protein [uncultured Terrisporobacter sp.]
MEKITYFLCESNESSTEFYKKNLNFSKKVLNKLEGNFSNDINDYMNYINKNNMEQLRSKSEYLLEILMIGVFWKEHVNKAISLSKIPRNILIKLSTLREKESIKKIVDINRGLLEYLFLNRRSNDKVKISLENYKKLVNYLKACGDYKEEAKRLEVWISYFFSLNKNKVEKILTSYLEFAKYFEDISQEALGIYTKNVNLFLKNIDKKYKYREDFLFCSRKEVEYHLNMVGAQIMNEAYRKEFLKTKEKRLLLPSCMRIKDEKNCKAIKTEEGYICNSCSKNCNVNKYDKLGKKYNFQVYIIPHESSISVKNKIKYGHIGIIGVACVLNLISGGLKAKNLGFVPQCVFLDYCGCKDHRHDKGIITDINMSYLLYSLGIEEC